MAAALTERSGDQALWLRRWESLSSRRIEGTDGASYPFWSPDGNSIGFFAAGKLKRIDLSGGGARVQCQLLQPQFLGDGRHVVFLKRSGNQVDDGVFITSLESGSTKLLSHVEQLAAGGGGRAGAGGPCATNVRHAHPHGA